jgi:hypothetical protein
MTHTSFVRGRPQLVVQQMGDPFASEDEFYRGCIQLRAFVRGCDYYDRERDDAVGSIARRKSDDRIFAAPDHRFLANHDFEVLWFKERRTHAR